MRNHKSRVFTYSGLFDLPTANLRIDTLKHLNIFEIQSNSVDFGQIVPAENF